MPAQIYPSVAKTTLGGGSTVAEEYIPLWVYSSGTVAGGSATAGDLVYKGSNATINGDSRTSSAGKLYTLNSNWSNSQKFAFEVSMYTNIASNVYAALWDCTTGTLVSASQVTATTTTATLLRSGSFMLTPGHQYGVTLWAQTYSCYLTKAHLVALTS